MSTPYKICDRCGAHLDSGERCDCTDLPAADRATAKAARITPPERAYHGAIVGVDLARGTDFTAWAPVPQRREA